MFNITLYNLKRDESKPYLMYKPSKKNKDKYEIIFTSDKEIFFQFILYVKFSDWIKISQSEEKNKLLEWKNFPYNGILYSCKITPINSLTITINPLDLCTRIIIQKQLETPVNTIKLNSIQWNKIFIINLTRRTDRKKKMEEFFNKANIPKTHYEFINAYDGKDKKIISQYTEKKRNDSSFSIITSGHFACLLSHLKAIEIAKSRGYKYIMILEDDVFTSENNLICKLNSIQVPEYDLLYLGGIMSKKKKFTNNWVYSNKTNIIGAYGYILSHTIFDKVLSDLKDLNEYIDFYYLKNIQANYKIICLEDIIKTDLSSSDTSNKSRTMIKRLDYIK